jgi:hypothetical protein
MTITKKTFAWLLCLAALSTGSASTYGATVEVGELRLVDFDFVMTVKPNAGHLGDTASEKSLDTSADLIAGAADPLLSFLLADVSFPGAGSESWRVEARTLGASTATIDTDTNEITINLSGWSTSWTQEGVVPPRLFRGCGGAFPECDAIDQSPATGSVTGAWDPLTGAFEVSWPSDISVHPFPLGVGNWTLRGQVVPVPAALPLMLSGLGLLGAMRLKRRRIAEYLG